MERRSRERVSASAPRTWQERAVSPAAEAAIGDHIAPLVPDGATLQLGIGAIPDAVLPQLFDKRDLGVLRAKAVERRLFTRV